MRWRIVVALAVAALVAAPAALGRSPSPQLRSLMAAHPDGALGQPEPILTPQYVYGQAFCYSAALQYVKGSPGGLASEGLWVRPVWCAVPGLAPHIYTIDQSYRYQVCSGLIQCAGTAGPFLAAGGNGSPWADYEWVGYFRWTAQGITASAVVHMVWELQENGTNWSYGWT
jgi:hypothetical protein